MGILFDFIWMHQDQFRARIAVPEFLSIQYNFNLTSWHILFVLAWDKDISDALAFANPELYMAGPRRELFNTKVVAKWMVFAVIQGACIWIIPQLMIQGRWFNGSDYEDKGPGTFWVASTTSFSACCWVVSIKLGMVSQNPFNKYTLISTATTLFFLMLALLTFSYVPFVHTLQPQLAYIIDRMFETATPSLAFVVTIVVALVPDIIEQCSTYVLCPNPLQRVQRHCLFDGGRNSLWSQVTGSEDVSVAHTEVDSEPERVNEPARL